MFGMKKRKRYNAEIDVKLNNEYQIKTRGNPLFPGVLAYLALIDKAWAAKWSADEGALFIATAYCHGVFTDGNNTEGERLLERIDDVGNYGVENQTISSEIRDQFSQILSRWLKEL